MIVTVRCKVTPMLIARGIARDCYRCPVAAAVDVQLPPGHVAAVTGCSIQVYRDRPDGLRLFVARADVPGPVGEFVDRFDSRSGHHRGRARPLEFDLEFEWPGWANAWPCKQLP